ncbi:argininosuccinate lyase [Planctomycetota bacterium]
MTQNTKRNWEKRLSGEPNALMMSFVESLSFDQRLYKYDIAGSLAHADMLAQQGLITAKENQTIHRGLKQIQKDIEAEQFDFDTRYEDIHMAIENALIERIGEAGNKLHTGRSRNDQVATDLRLWMRDQIVSHQQQIIALQRALVDLAGQYSQALLPAYTHFQRAQPMVIGSYLLSFVEQLERDFIRLGNCGALSNVSPLGSGAIAGSTLALDRQQTCRSLDFDGLTRNSLDGVSDRDFCAEFIFDCCMIALHLSKLAEDWIVYASSEFGFVRIDDTFCTSSSMMPQKRNPDALELIRGKTGSVVGALMAMLTILKAQPSGYNRDLQEDKVHVFRASDTIGACLELTAALVGHTQFNVEHIAENLDEGFLDATALAEYLVMKGMPFRQAHGVVGALVSWCEAQNQQLQQVELDVLQSHCPMIEQDVYRFLGAAQVAKHYATEGAGGPKQFRKQHTAWTKRLAKR